jgi:hypothetical protein
MDVVSMKGSDSGGENNGVKRKRGGGASVKAAWRWRSVAAAPISNGGNGRQAIKSAAASAISLSYETAAKWRRQLWRQSIEAHLAASAPAAAAEIERISKALKTASNAGIGGVKAAKIESKPASA